MLLRTGIGRLTRLLTGSLRNKLIAWFFVPTAIILVAVALVNFNSYQNVTEDLVVERDRDLTQLWAGQIATNLDRFPKVLSDVSHTLGISKQSGADVQASLVRASPQLRIFDGGVIILDTFGTVTATHPLHPALVGQNWSDRAHFRQMLRIPGPVFSDVLYDSLQETEVIEVAVPIFGDQSEFLGSIVGVFHLRATTISAFYSGILTLRIGNGGSYIVDGNGKVLYHDNRDQVGADFGTRQPVTRVLLGEVGAIRNRDEQGTDLVSAFAPIPGTPWGLITEESWSSLTSGSRNTQRFLLGLLALGVAVPAIVVAIGLKSVMRPVEELKKAAKEVARGNFGHTIAVRSGDEIEELANEFNLMSLQLKDSYEQLEQRVVERTEALAASEKRYRGLFDDSRDAIFVSSAEGTITDCNQAALQLFGFTKESALGSDIGDRFVEPAERDQFREEVSKTGSVTDFEVRLTREDGTPIYCLITATRRHGADGSNLGVQGTVRDITERKQAEQELVQQTRDLAVLEERNRMAREIHDTLAQGFTGIVLQLEAAEQALEQNPDQVPERLLRAKSQARESLQEARRSVWDLIPRALEEGALDVALKDEVERFTAFGRERATFHLTGRRRELPRDVQAALLRICQESLTNARRHANASEVRVELAYSSGGVSLIIHDDGTGFNPDETLADGRQSGFGLGGMKERARIVNGELTVTSERGQGTSVEVRIQTA